MKSVRLFAILVIVGFGVFAFVFTTRSIVQVVDKGASKKTKDVSIYLEEESLLPSAPSVVVQPSGDQESGSRSSVGQVVGNPNVGTQSITKVSPQNIQPIRDYHYYVRGYKALKEYIETEDIVNRLNKNEVSDAQREYFYKILEKESDFQLKAIDLKLAEIEKRLRS